MSSRWSSMHTVFSKLGIQLDLANARFNGSWFFRILVYVNQQHSIDKWKGIIRAETRALMLNTLTKMMETLSHVSRRWLTLYFPFGLRQSLLTDDMYKIIEKLYSFINPFATARSPFRRERCRTVRPYWRIFDKNRNTFINV